VTRVRIKDIAEIAQVSVGTVDRVIHNRGEVSQATRDRIRKLLLEYNYKPDIHASTLALKKIIRLAVFMPAPVNEHAFWNLPASGIQRALKELAHFNIHLETCYFDQFDRHDFERCREEFPFAQVQGVLFAPVFKEESKVFLNQCESWNLPVVLFNSLLEGPSVRSFVGQDAYRSGYVAGKLIHYGMETGRNAAIVNMSARTENYAHIENREKGFRAYFQECTDRVDHLLTFNLHGADDANVKKQLKKACEEHEPAGLFVTNSRVYKVAEILSQQGPNRVRLVGYDLLPESIHYLKAGAIDFLISQSPEEQAFRGISSLFHLVAFQREPQSRQMLPIDIITRENLDYYQPISQE
jgi:LacI family transcriptional regulator